MLPFRFWMPVLTLVAASGWSQAGFWTGQELSDQAFQELDGNTLLLFKDAVTAKPVAGAAVTIADSTLSTDARGAVLFKGLAEVTDQDIPIHIESKGYIPLDDVLRVRLGTVINPRFALSADLPPNQARFVLEWDKQPVDLDAWLYGPGFTVSYRATRNSAGNATLDRDARNGYGPETLTLQNIRPDQTYLFSVQNYSKEKPMTNVRIALYLNGRLAKRIWISAAGAPRVDVIRIAGGQVEYLEN